MFKISSNETVMAKVKFDVKYKLNRALNKVNFTLAGYAYLDDQHIMEGVNFILPQRTGNIETVAAPVIAHCDFSVTNWDSMTLSNEYAEESLPIEFSYLSKSGTPYIKLYLPSTLSLKEVLFGSSSGSRQIEIDIKLTNQNDMFIGSVRNCASMLQTPEGALYRGIINCHLIRAGVSGLHYDFIETALEIDRKVRIAERNNEPGEIFQLNIQKIIFLAKRLLLAKEELQSIPTERIPEVKKEIIKRGRVMKQFEQYLQLPSEYRSTVIDENLCELALKEYQLISNNIRLQKLQWALITNRTTQIRIVMLLIAILTMLTGTSSNITLLFVMIFLLTAVVQKRLTSHSEEYCFVDFNDKDYEKTLSKLKYSREKNTYLSFIRKVLYPIGFQ